MNEACLIISEYSSNHIIYMDTGVVVTGLSGILFEVRGANEMYLGLSQTTSNYPNTNIYEIDFNANRNNIELKRGELGTKLDEYTGTVHNANTYTRLWTTWANGHIQVGQGFTIGKNILVEAVDNAYDVNFIIVATQSGETSYWRFYVNGRKPLGKF